MNNEVYIKTVSQELIDNLSSTFSTKSGGSAQSLAQKPEASLKPVGYKFTLVWMGQSRIKVHFAATFWDNFLIDFVNAFKL